MQFTICVHGLGHIGLPTAALLAESGARVIGVDTNSNVVDAVNRGEIPFREVNLREIVNAAVASGSLRATELPEAADVFIISVPTPVMADRQADLSYVHAAIESIAAVVKNGDLIILESTVPVGTLERLADRLAQLRPDLCIASLANGTAAVSMAYSPERAFPGNLLRELIENDRVIGGLTADCATRATAIYRRFVRGEVVLTNSRVAEMVKLSENAFRDVNIAFANELSLICETQGIGAREVIRLANRHPRVNILNPGPGVGGHCVPIDPWFLIAPDPDASKLMRQARAVNDAMPAYVVERTIRTVADIPNPTIACLGLAYKADVSDLRESPALQVVKMLAELRVCHLLIAEPHIDTLPADFDGIDVELTTSEDAISRSDLVLLLVEHTEFSKFADAARKRRLIDMRGVWT